MDETTSEKQLSMERDDAVVVKDGAVDVAPDRPRLHPLLRTALLMAVMCASFLFAIDNTIVAVVQPRLVEQFGEIDKLPWISVSYQLGSAAVNLLWGRLYHNFDQKPIFLGAMVLFEVGSAVCGAAPSMNAFIVGRVICGLGGNGIYNGTMNVLANMTTIQERPLYIALFGVVWATGTVLGPIVGGAFTSMSYSGWRWSFYINLCIAAVFAPVYLFVLPSTAPQKGKTISQRLRHLDYLGLLIFVGAWVAGVIALSFGGAVYAWSSGNIIAPLVLSGVLWIAFVLQQTYSLFVRPNERLFPVHLLASRENWVFSITTAAANVPQFLPVYYLPLYFQFVHTDSALQAGVRLLPFVCGAVFFCLLNGALMVKLGYYQPWFVAGPICVVIGAALMTTVGVDTNFGAIYGFTFLLGSGVGAYTQASFPVMQAKSPATETANVVALLVCAQKFGLTIGFSVANAAFINTASSRIAKSLPNAPLSEVQDAIAGVSATLFSGLSAFQKGEVLTAVTKSIDDVYYQVLAAGALSLVCAIFMKWEKLFGPQAVSPSSVIESKSPESEDL